MKGRLVCFFFAALLPVLCFAQVAVPGKSLTAWQEGYFDIHHINTGKGNAAFFIFPDSTTALVDAGELSPLDPRTNTPRNAAAKPDGSRKPFEWVVEYIRRVAPQGKTTSLDHAIITHFHDDHFGAWYPDAPVSATGNFRLTGITGVVEHLRTGQLIDRGFPHYNDPYNLTKEADKKGGGEIEFGNTMANYFSFLRVQQSAGLRATALKAGSDRQITLLYRAERYPFFKVRGIKSGRWLWTGKDSAVRDLFPKDAMTGRLPDENSMSLVLTFQYGDFLYYTGGDCAGNLVAGEQPWRNVETAVASVVGEVDVAVMDHHGNRDAVNEFQVQTLRPRVWIGQSWSADHPGHEVLLRMTSRHLYPGDRDLFATNMLDANRHVIGPLIDRSYQSAQGHVVVRVVPGGATYYVIVLDDTTAAMPVKSVFGPYFSKKQKASKRQ